MTVAFPDKTASPPEHRTAARVMKILELVLASEAEGSRLTDLSLEMDAPKSSVHGLTKGLLAIGYLREDGGRYFPGPAFSSFFTRSHGSIPAIYRHVLDELVEKWSETAILAALVGDSVVHIDCSEPDTLLRAAPLLRQRMPLWPRSTGKCFLAFMPLERLDAYLRRHHSSLPALKIIRKELADVRKTRIATNYDSASGFLGISSPVVSKSGEATLVLAIGGPKVRMQKNLEKISKSLRQTAESLSSLS